MSDAVFFGLAGLIAAGAIALALVLPQGLGARSPAPFGHPVTPELIEPAAAPAAGKPSAPAQPPHDTSLKGPL